MAPADIILFTNDDSDPKKSTAKDVKATARGATPVDAATSVIKTLADPEKQGDGLLFHVSRALDTGNPDHTNLELDKTYKFIYAVNTKGTTGQHD